MAVSRAARYLGEIMRQAGCERNGLTWRDSYRLAVLEFKRGGIVDLSHNQGREHPPTRRMRIPHQGALARVMFEIKVLLDQVQKLARDGGHKR